ncbi:ATP-dependent RecD-like DNA helicase [Thalassocella blandensis]|nr:ATP-dependent RecD-like DNA helicase [Thalassocella blandensis]
MDETERLILIEDKSGRWQVKTREVEICEDAGKFYQLKFYSQEKVYRYPKSRVQYFQFAENITLENIIVSVEGFYDTDWDSVKCFGPYVCLYKLDKCYVLDSKDVQFIANASHHNNIAQLRRYFEYLAKLIANETIHLNYYYQKLLDSIRPDCVLKRYAEKEHPDKYQSGVVLYPFGVNPSQRKAVVRALENQVSLIQGPPGTGKTQTILNILANLLYLGKTVAIVSGNNSATKNVYEKLEKYGLEFLAASLGNKQLQEEFFKQEHSLPDLKDKRISKQQKQALLEGLGQRNALLDQLLESRNMLAIKTEQLSRVKIEREYFNRAFPISPVNPAKWSFANRWSTPNLLKFLAEVKYYSQFESIKFSTKISWLYKYRIYKFSDFSFVSKELVLGIVAEYYRRRVEELEKEIIQLNVFLSENDFDSVLAKCQSDSLLLLWGSIAEKFTKFSVGPWNVRNYKQKFEGFNRRFPIVLSTTDSIINNKKPSILFDYLIVDESSQVDLISGFLAMSCAKNIVAVGDLNQLPHIPSEKVRKNQSSINAQYSVEAEYSYSDESLLSSLSKVFSGKCPVTLLAEHYRCHPRIIDFCNQKFYGGQLVIMTESNSDPFKVYTTGDLNHARRALKERGWFNRREIDVIKEEVLCGDLYDVEPEEVGVISPYRLQVKMAKQHLQSTGVEVDTVYQYQGREKSVIVYSTTSNSINDFVDNANLINVAVSRAKDRFIIVTAGEKFKALGTNTGDLIRHIEYQSISPNIVESKIVSIFDCLYKDYSGALDQWNRTKNSSSQFLTENLMADLLDNVLSSSKYNSFHYKTNYSLCFLITDFKTLTEDEETFVKNPWSHIDFLLYNKLDKSPVLAIEVDGYKNHNLDKKQIERDKLKNSILSKIGIPLIRFPTNGSMERSRLENAINELMMDLPVSEDVKVEGVR